MEVISLLLATAPVFQPLGAFGQAMQVKLYKYPNLPCCGGHAAYLRKNSFEVDIIPTPDLLAKFAEKGVPPELNGCHLIEMGRYLVIGHIPIEPIRKMLQERPNIVGISIPGMPTGLPGMDGPRSKQIAVYEISPVPVRAAHT
jgi:hypothetical protein